MDGSSQEDIAMIAEATARIFADLADLQTLNSATDDAWRAPLWDAVTEAGLPLAWVPEHAGGVGLTIDAGFEICRIAGQYACPVPLVETLLAGWVLQAAGIALPPGALTIGMMRRADALDSDGSAMSGVLASVPFAAQASGIVVVSGTSVMLFTSDMLTVTPRGTYMGDARADVRIENVTPERAEWTGGSEELFRRIGATARACQMAGALETVLSLATDYTGEREAFGRKIGKLQAVQQMMARLAGEVAAALTASGSAAATLAADGPGTDAAFFEVAAAKIRVGEAAHDGAMIAHQAHGAIGWTSDYVLQRLTRRIWAWRDDFGTEADWAVRLGQHAAGQGPEALWPMLTTR